MQQLFWNLFFISLREVPGLFLCLELFELKNIRQAYLWLSEQVCVLLCRRV